MRRIKRVKVIVTMLLLLGLVAGLSARSALAESTIAPSLVLSQLKITSSNGQFVTLYNTTDTVLDMSKYQLEYFNSYDLTKATSSRLIALSGSLPPHGYYMVNDSLMTLCYQLVINSISLGLSSTAGLVEILAISQTNPGGNATTIVQDYVGWSKTTISGAQTLPTNTNGFLLRQPVDKQNNPNIIVPGAGTWLSVQPEASNQCNLVSTASPITKIVNSVTMLLPTIQPPVVFLPALVNEISNAAMNSGLITPQVNEVLPNPSGSGNDSTDEFIEIYNPNLVAFNLEGYGLQTGTTSHHSYIFPAGSSLAPQSFTAYYSAKTGLSLSNSAGQVKLLDPSGNSISVSDVYGVAKDGQSWVFANGKWSWTNVISPGGINIISSQTSTMASVTIPTSSLVVSNAVASNSKTTPQSQPASIVKTVPKAVSSTPIHNWTLALVASAALLYGAYDYRADLGNRIYKFRKYLRNRQADWSKLSWRRSRRTDQ